MKADAASAKTKMNPGRDKTEPAAHPAQKQAEDQTNRALFPIFF